MSHFLMLMCDSGIIISVLSHEFLEFPVNLLETDMDENNENKKNQTKNKFFLWNDLKSNI